jgi:hypothetical protein
VVHYQLVVVIFVYHTRKNTTYTEQVLAAKAIVRNSGIAAARVENMVTVDGTSPGGTSFNFTPIHVQFNFEDSSLIECIGVTMSLPSGMGRMDDLSRNVFCCVSDDGRFLVLKCAWPTNLRNYTLLYRAMIKDGENEDTVKAMVKGVRKEIVGIKHAFGATDTEGIIGSTSQIVLQKVCEKDIIRETALEDPHNKGLQLTVILRVAGQPERKKPRKTLMVQKFDDDSEDEIPYDMFAGEED